MESSTANSTGSLPQTLPTSPSVLFNALLLSCYLASIFGFLVLITNGFVIIRTQYVLHTITNTYGPTPASNQRNLRIQPATDTDTERALTQQDVLATAVMKRARALALFGPLPTIPTLVAIPASLHGVASDVPVRLLLSALLIAIIHCANACTVQTYFSFFRNETKITFGPEICSATQEKARSRGLMKVYLTVLFFLSCVWNVDGAEDVDVAALDARWEPATTYGSRDGSSTSPGMLDPLTEDFPDTSSLDSMELKRVV